MKANELIDILTRATKLYPDINCQIVFGDPKALTEYDVPESLTFYDIDEVVVDAGLNTCAIFYGHN